MILENITAHFMVDMEAETKHDCFAVQCVDMMLRLIAPELSYKPWNYYFPEKKDVGNFSL